MRKRHIVIVAVLLVVVLGAVCIRSLSGKEGSAYRTTVLWETRIPKSDWDDSLPQSASTDNTCFLDGNGAVPDEEQDIFQAASFKAEENITPALKNLEKTSEITIEGRCAGNRCCFRLA